MKLVKEFTFDAAHKVACFANNGHKCGRLHGHSYKVGIEVDGEPDKNTGIIIDFFEIEKVWKPLFDLLDHNYLNDVPGLETPTAENIARWIFDSLKPSLSILSCVYLKEGYTDRVECRG
jgi:queuosine biosynthesis protein QueD